MTPVVAEGRSGFRSLSRPVNVRNVVLVGILSDEHI